MLSEDKFSLYFLYAIGEIILVVDGMLIAVQVINWNLKNIQNKKEIVYLDEIRKSLIQYLVKIEDIMAFNIKKDSCIDVGLGVLVSKMSNDD